MKVKKRVDFRIEVIHFHDMYPHICVPSVGNNLAVRVIYGLDGGITSKRQGGSHEMESGRLSRENLIQVMNRVIANKGSQRVYGMTVYELKQFLKIKWL